MSNLSWNTLTSNTAASTLGYPQSYTQNVRTVPFTTAGWPPYGFAQATEPRPHKLEIPVYDADSKEGVFIRNKDGELIYVPVRKIVELVGLTW